MSACEDDRTPRLRFVPEVLLLCPSEPVVPPEAACREFLVVKRRPTTGRGLGREVCPGGARVVGTCAPSGHERLCGSNPGAALAKPRLAPGK